MSREIGGRADKDGNEYERLWVVSLALLVLEGKATSLYWEPQGAAGLGAELRLTLPDGTCEAHQCKIENGIKRKWTVGDLKQAGVLQAARHQLEHGIADRFVFVSLDRPTLSDFAERAQRCNNDAQQFLESTESSGGHRGELASLWEAWDIDTNNHSEVLRAVALLQRLSFEHGFWAPKERDFLACHATFLAEGERQEIVESLGAFLTSRLGNEVHADELRCHLKAAGFPTRDLHGVSGPIERLQRLFENALCGFLVGDDLIPRTETLQVLDALLQEEGPRLVFLHGEAGSGKSGVLLELTRKLSDKGVPVLPLRFDIQRPQGSIASFSRDVLELPAPPAQCLAALAGIRRSVLIIDQLDAIRWTGAHSDAAWTIAQEIIEAALTRPEMRVVLACRTFDLNDDPRIKSWQELKTRNAAISFTSRVEVKPFSEETVRGFILSQKGRYEDFSPRQQQLLANPHNLYLWWTLHREQAVPQNFDSKAKLMAKFWETRRRGLQEKGINATDTEALLDKLVGYLDTEGRLDAPTILVSRYKLAFDALRSLGVLHEPKPGSVKFTHQSYLDYLIAERVFSEALSGGGKPVDWIRRNDQSLFRRDQARQMLVLLQEQRLDLYLDTLRDLFTATDIRFHLQYLALELLHHTQAPSKQELLLVRELLSSAAWHQYVFKEVLSGSTVWFEQLDDSGVLAEWLASSSDQAIQEALLLCRSATEFHAERVEKLLISYWSTGEEDWQRRIEIALPFEAVHDTDEMFAWRLALIRAGHRQIEWYHVDILAKAAPSRAILLLEAFLMKALDGFESSGRLLLRDWHKSTTTHIKNACRNQPEEAWQKLLPILERARTGRKTASQARRSKPDDSESRRSEQELRKLIWRIRHLLSLAGAELARSEGHHLTCRLQNLDAGGSRSLQRLILSTLLHAKDDVADFAIDWLCRDSRRLELGTGYRVPRYEPARLLVERFASKCSLNTYRQLEAMILTFHPFQEKEGIRWGLEHRRGQKGGLPMPNEYGLAQGELLKAMPKERLSERAESFSSLWRGKFESSWLARFRPYRYSDTPSIPDEKLHFVADRQWLQLIEKDRLLSCRKQGYNDATRIQHAYARFAGEMRAAAEREPSRFARLALQIPPTAPLGYVQSLIEVFSELKPSDRIKASHPQWAPATTSDVEAILNSVDNLQDKSLLVSVCRLVTKRAGEDWSKRTIERIIRNAATHPDPDAGETQSEDLNSTAINSVRGLCCGALRTLIDAQPDYLGDFLPVVRRLMEDPNPAVRIAAQGICLPIYDLDRDLAIQLFVTSCSHPDSRVLEGFYLNIMLRLLWAEHPEQVEPILERMVLNNNEKLAEKGAFWATAGRIGEGLYERIAIRCRSGTSAQRQGVASALCAMYSNQKWKLACASELPAFFEDPDKKVGEAASQVFRRAAELEDRVTSDLVLQFVTSISFERDQLSLIFPLERHKGSLLPLSKAIKSIATRLSGDLAQASKNSSVARYFVPILLRLYEQAEGEHNREIRELCLNAWDDLLRSGIEIGRQQLQLLES